MLGMDSYDEQERQDWYRSMCFLLQNLCEEFEFEVAQFFKKKGKKGKEYLSCKEAPFHIENHGDKE